jgi:hypothetical protein
MSSLARRLAFRTGCQGPRVAAEPHGDHTESGACGDRPGALVFSAPFELCPDKLGDKRMKQQKTLKANIAIITGWSAGLSDSSQP